MLNRFYDSMYEVLPFIFNQSVTLQLGVIFAACSAA